MNPETTVFVVDDDRSVLKSLEMLMGTVGMNVKTYHCGEDFLNDYVPSQSGCLVLDVRMPNMSGLELQQKLKERNYDIPVVIITGHGDVPMAVEAMKAGAFDFIEKPFRDQILLDAVNRAIKKDAQAKEIRDAKAKVTQKCSSLTTRERQIMDLLVSGESNKKIAYKLNISIKTVDYHRLNMMDKMGVSNLVQLTQLVQEGD